MHIDGELNGDIHSTSTVSIGKTGVVKCELEAQKLVVAGKFHGNADCELIEVLAGGEVDGQLTAASLAVDGGGIFHGQSVRKKPSDDSTTVVKFTAEKPPKDTAPTTPPKDTATAPTAATASGDSKSS